jgi:hypothetical protein
MAGRRLQALGVALGLVVTSSAASCARDSGSVSRSAPDAVPAGADPVAARVAELRERFVPRPQRPVIGPGVAVKFEPVAAGLVQAVVPASVRRQVRRTATVELPATADRAVRITDDTSQLGITFTLLCATASPLAWTHEGIALYSGAAPGGADIVHRVHAEGTEDFVVFEARPAAEELDYDVDVSRVAGLRLVSNVLEFLDAAGTPRLRIAPPSVVDAAGARIPAALAVDGCAFDRNPVAPWRRQVMASGATNCRVSVTWRGSPVEYPAIVDPSWVATGSMTTGRTGHTSTTLPSGEVLVAGGSDSATLSSAELFDGTGTFAATGSMTAARTDAIATLLPSGKVLLAGGQGATASTSSAELFDGTGTFTATGSMSAARAGHTGTLLAGGNVLVAGGSDAQSVTLSSAEIFDGTGTFTVTGAMTAPRVNHTATLLNSGKVLMAGGGSSGSSSAELFDGTGTFTATGAMTTPRASHTATLLNSGKVLVAGGDTTGPSTSAELFDGTSSFAATGSILANRGAFTATLLRSGDVLVAGGNISSPITEVFDGTSMFSQAGSLTTGLGVGSPAAALLASGQVLITGGFTNVTSLVILSSAEIYALTLPGGACSTVVDCASGICTNGN